jgi:PAS domain S-box-containing protein
MQIAAIPKTDTARIASLHRLRVLDCAPEAGFDALVEAASLVCGTPIALLSLIDADRQWFLANIGLSGVSQTPRDQSFCAHAILDDGLLEVPDATSDPRFAGNPLVEAEPCIRFYAGMPLCLDDGSRVGTLCVIDRVPRQLDDTQRKVLQRLAQSATNLLQERRARLQLHETARDLAASEEHQRQWYDRTPVMLQRVDAAGNVMSVSDQWLERMGYDRHDVIGRSMQDFMTPESYAYVVQKARAPLFETGRCDRLELQFVTSGGEVLDIRYSAVLEGKPDGRPQDRLGVLEEITQLHRAEAALRKSEELLAHTGQTAAVGGWELDLDTNELFWTDEGYRIHGVSAGYQPTVASAIDFYAEEARPLIRDAVGRCIRDGGRYELELPFIRATGEKIWVRTIGAATRAGGRTIRLNGAIQDVTDAVTRRMAVQEVHNRLALATESGGIGIWWWQADGTLQWDDRMYRLYGMPPGDGTLPAGLWSSRVHPDDRPAAEAAFIHALAGSDRFDFTFRIILGCGSIRHIGAAGLVTRDETGLATQVIGTNIDITDALQVAAELEQRNEFLRVTLNAISDGVITTDAEGHIIWFNSAAERLIGLPSAAAIGQRLDDVFQTRGAPAAPDEPGLVGTQLLSRNGTFLWIEHATSPLPSRPGVPPGAVLMFRDVSARKELEAERKRIDERLHQTQRLEAVGQLTAGVAHDFNNLLQGILTATEVLGLQTGLDEVGRDCLGMIEPAVKRGATLVHQLLAFARKQVLNPKVLDPAEVLAGLEPLLTHTLGSRLRIAISVSDGIGVVNADATQLESALLNLALNARDAMPDGGVLRLSASHEGAAAAEAAGIPAGDYVRFAVTDTGQGMSAEIAARAFEPFFTTKPIGQGSGLGLSMVHGFAEQSGGSVRISSAHGTGTTVSIWLPRLSATRHARRDPQARQTADHGLGRVLLVDDEPILRNALTHSLNRAGYRAVAAKDAEAALALLQSGEHFDLLITDQSMPGRSGTELIAEVLRHWPHLPTMLISGYDMVKGLDQLSGNVVLLKKPFERNVLLKHVQMLLSIVAVAVMSAGE